MLAYVQSLGYLGCSIMSLQGVPQIWRMYKTKSTKDISYSTIALSCVGGALTIVYGVLIQEPPIYATVSFTMCMNAMLLVLKCRYDARNDIRPVDVM